MKRKKKRISLDTHYGNHVDKLHIDPDFDSIDYSDVINEYKTEGHYEDRSDTRRDIY